MTALESIALGDSLFVDGNYDGAIENYTAAICMTDIRRKVATASSADSTTTTKNGDDDAAETKAIRFRSLSHRSETYLSLSKYPHAYNDASDIERMIDSLGG